MRVERMVLWTPCTSAVINMWAVFQREFLAPQNFTLIDYPFKYQKITTFPLHLQKQTWIFYEHMCFVVIILIYFQLCPLRITSKYFARVAYWEGDLFSQSDPESHSSHLLCCILLLAPTYILIHNCWKENYMVIIVIKQMGPFLCQICLFFLLFSNRSKPILIYGVLSQHAWVLAISSVFKMSLASIMANT